MLSDKLGVSAYTLLQLPPFLMLLPGQFLPGSLPAPPPHEGICLGKTLPASCTVQKSLEWKSSNGDRKTMGAPESLRLIRHSVRTVTYFSIPPSWGTVAILPSVYFSPVFIGDKSGVQNAFLMTEICVSFYFPSLLGH